MGSAALLRSFLRSVVVAVLFVIAFEATARDLDWLDPTTRPDPYLGLAGTPPLYPARTAEDGATVHTTAENKSGFYRVLSFPDAKPPDEYRVFCIGGSSVRSDAFMDPDGSFPAMLQIDLTAQMPGRTARVINAGGGGMGSLQNLEVLREVLGYAPDLVVLYPEGGEKNFLPPAPLGVMAQRDDEAPLRVAARRRLAGLRLYDLARQVYQSLLPPVEARGPRPSAFSAFVLSVISRPFDPDNFTRLFEMKDDRPPPLMRHPIPDEQLASSYDRFRRVFETEADLCADAGVPLVVVLPVKSLRDSFYLRFHIDPGEILPGRVDEWRTAYAEGLAAKRDGRYAEALGKLAAVRACYVKDTDQILAFDMGQCLEALGRTHEAQVEYARPYLRHPMRLLTKQLAEERDLPLVDAFPALVAASKDGIPGYDEFTDAFHPMPKTNRILAHSIMRVLRDDHVIADLLPEGSEQAQRADRDIYGLMGRCHTPVHTVMRQACSEGRWQDAVAAARAVPEKVLFRTMFVETMYLGWASVRSGDIDGARQVYRQMRKSMWSAARGEVPALDTDEDIVRIAYGGDLFAFF